MAIDDLLDVSKFKDVSWKKCRIQVGIAFKIIHRMKELSQMDLVDSAIGTLLRYISENLKLEKHIQLQVDCRILMLGRSLSTQESPIDCFIKKIIEFTTKQEPNCEHIYQQVYNIALQPSSEFCKAALNENKQDSDLNADGKFEEICRKIIDNKIACAKMNCSRPFKDIGAAHIQFKNCSLKDMMFIADVGFFVSERRYYNDFEYSLTTPPVP